MPNITLVSTFASSVVVGDPGYWVTTLPPKESKSLPITEAQLRQLTPQLEKLAAAGWLTYTTGDVAAPVEVVVAPPVVVAAVETPPPAPDPVAVVETVTPVETAPVADAPVDTAPAEAASTETTTAATETAPAATETAPTEATADVPAPPPSAPSGKKNRNR